jgi:hypothetical protein
MTKTLALAVLLLAACGDAAPASAPGICHVLDSDDGPIVIFRPCEDPDADVCVTRILDGQTIHSMAETTDCRSCLSDRYTLTGTGVEFFVGGDDVDFACARYDG